jgi:membrane protease YdiL (CAAX protease family)
MSGNPTDLPRAPETGLIELTFVLTLTLGWAVYGSFAQLGAQQTMTFNESGLLGILLWELVLLVLVLPFLVWRGWSSRLLGLEPGWRDTVLGIAAGCGVTLASIALGALLQSVGAKDVAASGLYYSTDWNISLATIVVTNLINGLYEELFVCGYVITVLSQRFSMAVAINASVAIRLSYHLYQGPDALIFILPFGLACALWYARTRRLWLLAVMHATVDIIVFAWPAP